MALAGQRLTVPAVGQTQFRDRFYPRLRQMATVISSDGSFTPPVISDPTLVLRASYGDGHDVQVDWEWAYQVGDSQLRAELHQAPGDVGYRDADAERAVLDGLRLGGLPGHPDLVPTSRLGGLDTMRFTTELLPLLAGQPGVERRGRRRARRLPRGRRLAARSACPPPRSPASATGSTSASRSPSRAARCRSPRCSRRSPAASRTCCSPTAPTSRLDKPELQALARLIEEARALQDVAGGPLRISRFQAGLWEELAALGVVGHQAAGLAAAGAGRCSSSTRVADRHAAAGRRCGAELRPYQLDGFGWLAFLWEHRLGGILADDMGLGKTLQALALICHARQARPGRRAVPGRRADQRRVELGGRGGAVRARPDGRWRSPTRWRAAGADARPSVAGADVVVTTYTLLRLDSDAYARAWTGPA